MITSSCQGVFDGWGSSRGSWKVRGAWALCGGLALRGSNEKRVLVEGHSGGGRVPWEGAVRGGSGGGWAWVGEGGVGHLEETQEPSWPAALSWPC